MKLNLKKVFAILAIAKVVFDVIEYAAEKFKTAGVIQDAEHEQTTNE